MDESQINHREATIKNFLNSVGFSAALLAGFALYCYF